MAASTGGTRRRTVRVWESCRRAPATSVETIARRFGDASDGNFTLGAFEDGGLIGMATLIREAGLKERHKGRIYGVYVTHTQRRKGVARVILAELLERAQRDLSLEQVLLAVATCQNAARQLYRDLGFVTYGTEPHALKVGSTYIDEDHMIYNNFTRLSDKTFSAT